MARRHDVRRVKIHRSYLVPEVARLLGVNKHTVSRWIARGLPLVERKRPYLILGGDLRSYLAANRPKRQQCKAGEFFCLACRAPRRPAGDTADYLPRNERGGVLRGLCPECGTLIHRVTSTAKFATAVGDLTVSCPLGQERLVDSSAPNSNVDFKDKKR